MVEQLTELPDSFWAAALFVLALLYVVHITLGLDRAWRWLMMEEENEVFARRWRERETAEAAVLRRELDRDRDESHATSLR